MQVQLRAIVLKFKAEIVSIPVVILICWMHNCAEAGYQAPFSDPCLGTLILLWIPQYVQYHLVQRLAHFCNLIFPLIFSAYRIHAGAYLGWVPLVIQRFAG